MTLRVRHTSISTDAKASAVQNSENARDLNLALERRVLGYLQPIARYAAIGTTTATIPLFESGNRPSAVLLVHAHLSDDPGADINVQARCNFYHTETGLGVYEPSGLLADTMYDLTFLVLE